MTTYGLQSRACLCSGFETVDLRGLAIATFALSRRHVCLLLFLLCGFSMLTHCWIDGCRRTILGCPRLTEMCIEDFAKIEAWFIEEPRSRAETPRRYPHLGALWGPLLGAKTTKLWTRPRSRLNRHRLISRYLMDILSKHGGVKHVF